MKKARLLIVAMLAGLLSRPVQRNLQNLWRLWVHAFKMLS